MLSTLVERINWRKNCIFHAMEESLRIVIIAPTADTLESCPMDCSRNLHMALLENGLQPLAVLPADPFLSERLAQLRADLVVVDAESDARDALEHVVLATRDAPRPIVMFTNDSDPTTARAAVAAGVSAYVVAGLSPQRIRPVFDLALARFAHEQALRTDLQHAKTQLQDRKLIDRAKGILMQRQALTEEQAFQRMRKTAMDKGLKLRDVAQRILDAAELFG